MLPFRWISADGCSTDGGQEKKWPTKVSWATRQAFCNVED